MRFAKFHLDQIKKLSYWRNKTLILSDYPPKITIVFHFVSTFKWG